MQLGGLAGLTALTMGIGQENGASALTPPRDPVHTNGAACRSEAIAMRGPEIEGA